jgi:mono/diheme cytochrome c family protein
VRSSQVRSRRRPARPRLVAAAVALTGLAGFAGCDASEDADLDRGRALFQNKCGTCHVLAEAGTGANVGPNLDSAFARARADGMDNDTIEGVVQTQIAAPREPNVPEDDPDYARVYMPADIVEGQDAEDVATYVASVAGVPGAAPPPLGTASDVFAEKCASCHALEPGAPDGTGPNLAESLQGQDAAYIRQQILDPNSVIYDGFPEGVMPQNYEQEIPPKNLKELVDYLLQQVSGGG